MIMTETMAAMIGDELAYSECSEVTGGASIGYSGDGERLTVNCSNLTDLRSMMEFAASKLEKFSTLGLLDGYNMPRIEFAIGSGSATAV